MTKLDASGASLAYSTYLGGSADAGFGLALNGAGSAYLTGVTRSADFPTTAGGSTRPTTAASLRFCDEAGRERCRARVLHLSGWSGSDHGLDLALDAGGNAYLAGVTARWTSRLPQAPSIRATTAAGTPSSRSSTRAAPRSATPPTWAEARTRIRRRHRSRRRRQRLRDRRHALGGLPDDRGRFDTTYNGGSRCVRDEAQRERRLPRLLHLPGRKRRRPRHGLVVDVAGSAYLTGNTGRRISRRPRAPSIRLGTGTSTAS